MAAKTRLAAKRGGRNKEGAAARAGNADASLAAGGLLLLGSFACPCPFCYLGSAAFLINGIAGKISLPRKKMPGWKS
ncbi:MAG: hypothetical protein WCT52_03025 [Candidatus Micrarchaeia archaeon]